MFHLIGGWMVREYRTWGVIMTSMLFILAVPVVNKGNASSSGKFLNTVFARIYKSPTRSIVVLLIILCAFLPWELKISSDFTIVPLHQIQVTPQVEGHIIKIYVDQGSRVNVNSLLLAGIENLDLAELSGNQGRIGCEESCSGSPKQDPARRRLKRPED